MDLVDITHPDMPGATAQVARDAYRIVWYPEGWRSDDDPDWTGPIDSIIERVVTLEAVPAGVAPTDPRLTDARPPTTHSHPVAQVTGLHAVATSGAYNDLGGKPTLGTAAAVNTGTGAGNAILGNDARLSDARTPTSHSHPVAQVTGLATVASSGAYADLSGRPTLATVATSGSYADLTNKPAIPAAPATVKLTADHANFTTTSLVNVTGLSFAITAGVYYRFRFQVVFRSAAITTGIGLGLTCPAFTVFSAAADIPIAADGAAAQFFGWITSSGDSVTASGVQATATDYLATVEGLILPSANGTLQLQAKSEVAASAVTVRQGSNGELLVVP